MLWGLVTGDCLGSPLQFTEMDSRPTVTEMEPCSCFNTPPGYWTDDASLAFCIMESRVRMGRYDLTDIGNNFVKWYRDGFWSSMPYSFDIGISTADAIEAIAGGSLKNGENHLQGNGSIMRFAPSYIMNLGAADDTMLWEISDLTHQSRRVREVISRMRRVCDAHFSGVRTTEKSPWQHRAEVDNSGWAVSTLDAALWAFHATDNFEDGLTAAVNLAGDSDTIGAVYGQIAGLYYGFDAIPKRWLLAIKDNARIDVFIEEFLNACGQ
jgi:ADP-ribosyl-[dinitrogen reductase] hydrolase